jgi:osmoprotectant transport system permease protein
MLKSIVLISCIFIACTVISAQTITVGAKHFNEGYILSEITSVMLENEGYTVDRKFNLGGTKICFDALTNRAIDLYPEYTGTISEEILKLNNKVSNDELKNIVLQNGLEISEPLGFNNTYALCIKKETADRLNIKKISDLVNHPELRIALSYEFLKRKDGWDNLSRFYDLKLHPVGIEHGLSYKAIIENKIDMTDAYSTDGEIRKYGLINLEDDKNFFPQYEAVIFYRMDMDVKLKSILNRLSGTINEKEMQEMNSMALFENKSFNEIAISFLNSKGLIKGNTEKTDSGGLADIVSKTLVHLKLSFIALLLAIIISIPAGLVIYRNDNLSRLVLYAAGLLQTIPSIALLALMIPLFGIGVIPAIAALFLYSILPILRNTITGLTSVDPTLKKVAAGIGLTNWQKLKYVEIPLSIPSILAGIKTASIINIGTATLAAFIGAGGLGEFIVTGLALNNTAMILKGAIPAALLAVITELVFELVEIFLVPKHLKQR